MIDKEKLLKHLDERLSAINKELYIPDGADNIISLMQMISRGIFDAKEKACLHCATQEEALEAWNRCSDEK